MERNPVCHHQDLLNSLLVRGDDDDRNSLMTAATLPSHQKRQKTSHQHDGNAEMSATNPQSSLHNSPNLNANAYAEGPPSDQAQNAPHMPSHFTRPRMHQIAESASHTQPQVTTLLSLEEFDKLYEVQPARVSSAVPVPVPIPLPATPKSDAVPKFNHLCQTRSITHLFTFEEISKGLFSSKVEFGGNVCVAKGPFFSKKQAKEAVAQQAIDVLESTEPPSPPLKEDRGKPKPKPKRKSSDQDDSENWVALLHEYAQKQHKPQPVYRYFEARMREQQQRGLSATPSTYSCVINLQARPLYDFGSEDEFFQTKVEAKRVAARSAVTWLRTMELLPESSDQTHSSPTQEASEMITEKSAAQLVVDHSMQLGLTNPQFDIRPAGDLTGKHFYVCTAQYLAADSRRVPQLEGPLCQTPPVFGQKNAKRMCIEALMVLLGRVISERMDVEER